MKIFFQFTILIPFILVFSACGGSDNGEQITAAGSATSGKARFGKEIGKGCDVLTAELVATTFSVPADSLKQMSVLGCLYTWENDEEELAANISMLRAHKSDTSAAAWFANSTRSRTVEEMKAEMDKVAARLEKNKELDTKAEKSMANVILNSAASKAVNFEDVANVGDEARSSVEGTIYVRVDNVTFTVAAYKGSKQPQPALSGMDVKEMIAASSKHSQEWMEKTAPQRTKDGAKLAAAIVASL